YESRVAMLLFATLTGLGILAVRRVTWSVVRKLRQRGYNNSNALVVGTGRVARKAARALRSANWMGIRNLGFIEERPNRFASDLNVIGTIADLPKLVAELKVEHVFIAVSLGHMAEARRVFDVLSRSLVEVRFIAD